MKEVLRYTIVLILVCVMAQAAAQEQSAFKDLLPQAERFEAVKSGNEVIYYRAYDNKGNFIGAVFKASSQGYSSTIETMADMTKEGLIYAVKVIAQDETPGVGSRVAEDSFTRRFAQKKFSDVGEVEAISGASVSSRAVIESVSKKAREVQELIATAKSN